MPTGAAPFGLITWVQSMILAFSDAKLRHTDWGQYSNELFCGIFNKKVNVNSNS